MKKDYSDKHTFVICAYKESSFLEECIESLEEQTVTSTIIMVTSTPCDYISNMAQKHGIELYVNDGETGISSMLNVTDGQHTGFPIDSILLLTKTECANNLCSFVPMPSGDSISLFTVRSLFLWHGSPFLSSS